MKFNRFIVGFGTFVLTTVLFYVVGFMFSIRWLMFGFQFTANANGLTVTTGSLYPLLFGMVISYIAEKMYDRKCRQK